MKALRPRSFISLVSKARDGEEGARSALKSAILEAPRGANGTCFISDRAAAVGSAERVRTLLVQSRPVAAVSYCLSNSDDSLQLISPEEGERQRQEWKTYTRAEQMKYADDLLTAAQTLVLGEGLPFQYGQKEGSFRLPNGRSVSARGALRRAGLSSCRLDDLADSVHHNEYCELPAREVERILQGSDDGHFTARIPARVRCRLPAEALDGY